MSRRVIFQRSTRLLAVAAAIYFLGTLPLAALGFDTLPSGRLIGANLLGLFVIFFGLSCLGLAALIAARSRRAPGHAGRDRLVSRDLVRRVPDAVLAIASFAVFNATFWRYKNIIPDVIPFVWDQTLYRLDRVLHFGDPWAILQPILGHAPVTELLGVVYGPAWVACWMGVLTWIAWSADGPLRRRYVLTYVLMWALLGNVLATALSSAGPAFFHQVVPGVPDPFVELRAYLGQALPFVVGAQEQLWVANGMRPHPVLVPPISAAPSLHIALVTLNAIAVSRSHAWLGRVLWVFLGLVFLATIHLGLHYAVDAYIAVAGLAFLWWLAGRWVNPSRNGSGGGLGGAGGSA